MPIFFSVIPIEKAILFSVLPLRARKSVVLFLPHDVGISSCRIWTNGAETARLVNAGLVRKCYACIIGLVWVYSLGAYYHLRVTLVACLRERQGLQLRAMSSWVFWGGRGGGGLGE